MNSIFIPQRPVRRFIPETFAITTWSDIKPWFDNLANRPIHSADDLRAWFRDLTA